MACWLLPTTNQADTREHVSKIVLGSTGDPPVPSGDSPDGTRATISSQCGRSLPKISLKSSGRRAFAAPKCDETPLRRKLRPRRRVADRSGRVARATHFQNTPPRVASFAEE